MLKNRPEWMANTRPEYMANHRPDWMIKNRPKLIATLNQDVPENIMKLF